MYIFVKHIFCPSASIVSILPMYTSTYTPTPSNFPGLPCANVVIAAICGALLRKDADGSASLCAWKCIQYSIFCIASGVRSLLEVLDGVR